MMRRFSVLLFFLALCLVTQARSETWQAWLYDRDTAHIMRIDGNGALLQQETLPLMFPHYGSPVIVSPRGTRMAYVVANEVQEQLVIYDSRPEFREIILQYPLPLLYADTIEFNQFYAQLFSEDDTHMAFSYVLADGGWEVLVIDIETGQAVHTLRSGEGIAADLPTQWDELPDTPVMPVIRSFDDDSVAFTFRGPDATGRIWESYRWDLQNNRVIPAPAYAVLEMDVYSPTGEIVQMLRRPGADEPRIDLFKSGADSEPETILMHDFAGDDPKFIENGTAIVYKTYMEARYSLRILRRGGSQPEIWPPSLTDLAYDIQGTASGFVYIHRAINSDDDDVITIYEVDTVKGVQEAVPVPVFTLTVNDGYTPSIIWFDDPRLTVAR